MDDNPHTLEAVTLALIEAAETAVYTYESASRQSFKQRIDELRVATDNAREHLVGQK